MTTQTTKSQARRTATATHEERAAYVRYCIDTATILHTRYGFSAVTPESLAANVATDAVTHRAYLGGHDPDTAAFRYFAHVVGIDRQPSQPTNHTTP